MHQAGCYVFFPGKYLIIKKLSRNFQGFQGLQKYENNTNILIVDDDRDIRNIIRTVLDEGNRHILDVANAMEAMQSIELTCPDIILLDIGLQGPVDGLSFTKRLQGT